MGIVLRGGFRIAYFVFDETERQVLLALSFFYPQTDAASKGSIFNEKTASVFLRCLGCEIKSHAHMSVLRAAAVFCIKGFSGFYQRLFGKARSAVLNPKTYLLLLQFHA